MSTPYDDGSGDGKGLETLTNLIYSLQVYGPVFEVQYNKSIKEFLSDHPRQFYISGNSVFLKGDTFVPRDRDPARRTQRGIRPKQRNKPSPRQLEIRKQIFKNLEKQENRSRMSLPVQSSPSRKSKKESRESGSIFDIFKKNKGSSINAKDFFSNIKAGSGGGGGEEEKEVMEIPPPNPIPVSAFQAGPGFGKGHGKDRKKKKKEEEGDEDNIGHLDPEIQEKIRENEGKLRNMMKGGLNIYDYERKKKADEDRLARELEEEVERAERMEMERKKKEEKSRRKREEKLRKREEKREEKKKRMEEKRRRKEEKRRLKLEQKKIGGDGGGGSSGGSSGGEDGKSTKKFLSQFQFKSRRADIQDMMGLMKESIAYKPPEPAPVISQPKDVVRVGRVRIDDKKGFIFENVDEKIKDMFEVSGIPPGMIHEEKQAKRIYEMLIRRRKTKEDDDEQTRKFINFELLDNELDAEELEGEIEVMNRDDVEEVEVEIEYMTTHQLTKLLTRVKEELSIREALQDEEERTECIVCFENYREMLFEPCCHMVLCGECAEQTEWKQCPFCRKKIDNIKKVFF